MNKGKPLQNILAGLQAELEKKRLEDAAEYEKRELMRRDSIRNSKLENEIKKKYSNIYLDFNALAKGYVVDVIGNYLEELGDSNYMIEIGGEVLARGKSPFTNKPWKIGIENPNQVINVLSSWNNKSIKTKSNSDGDWILKIETNNLDVSLLSETFFFA